MAVDTVEGTHTLAVTLVCLILFVTVAVLFILDCLLSYGRLQVIAFAMKEHGWSVYKALEFVKKHRSCVQPNPGFMSQLFVYEGILKAKLVCKKHIFVC